MTAILPYQCWVPGSGSANRYRADLLLDGGGVDFLEVIADHYLDAPPEKLRELDLLAERYTLIPHGLNLSLGSAEGLDPAYRDQLLGLVRRIEPPWWSEHVAFTRAGGVEIGHLAPLPFTHAGSRCSRGEHRRGPGPDRHAADPREHHLPVRVPRLRARRSRLPGRAGRADRLRLVTGHRQPLHQRGESPLRPACVPRPPAARPGGPAPFRRRPPGR